MKIKVLFPISIPGGEIVIEAWGESDKDLPPEQVETLKATIAMKSIAGSLTEENLPLEIRAAMDAALRDLRAQYPEERHPKPFGESKTDVVISNPPYHKKNELELYTDKRDY